MLTVAIKTSEHTNESTEFLSMFEKVGLKHKIVDCPEPVDVLVVVDRVQQFCDREDIYRVYQPLIGIDTEIFYIFPGGRRFERLAVVEHHEHFYHVGAYEERFWNAAFDEANRFINSTREFNLKML